MQRHKERFARNPRTAMAYRSWDKMDEKVQQALLDKADYYLANIEDVWWPTKLFVMFSIWF